MPRYLFISLFLILSTFQRAASTELVSVGLTSIQPPFIIDHQKQEGLVYDVLKAMNEHQDEYEFVSTFFPTKRLLADYKKEKIAIVAFNDVNWGWSRRNGVGSVILTEGRDVFISLKQTPRLKPDSDLAAVRGFHYAFANFNTIRLSNMPRVTLVKDEIAVVNMVLGQRVKRGITSEAYLNWLSVANPEAFKQLKIDPKEDHKYTRQFVVFPYSPISVGEINKIISDPKLRPDLIRIFSEYGLPPPPLR